MLAIEIQIRLKALEAERLLASNQGVATNRAYMADLDDEIAEVSAAYAGAAVREIATLRAELFGPTWADDSYGFTLRAEHSARLRRDQIPSGVTIDDYRRSRPQRRSRRHWLRIRPRAERRCCSRTPATQNPADGRGGSAD
jgi:hypothetical protein